jgi:hypothetical protein
VNPFDALDWTDCRRMQKETKWLAAFLNSACVSKDGATGRAAIFFAIHATTFEFHSNLTASNHHR